MSPVSIESLPTISTDSNHFFVVRTISHSTAFSSFQLCFIRSYLLILIGQFAFYFVPYKKYRRWNVNTLLPHLFLIQPTVESSYSPNTLLLVGRMPDTTIYYCTTWRKENRPMPNDCSFQIDWCSIFCLNGRGLSISSVPCIGIDSMDWSNFGNEFLFRFNEEHYYGRCAPVRKRKVECSRISEHVFVERQRFPRWHFGWRGRHNFQFLSHHLFADRCYNSIFFSVSQGSSRGGQSSAVIFLLAG